MTPVVYAIGGGLGHVSRALQLARHIGPCTVLHSARTPPRAPGSCELVRPSDPAAWLGANLRGQPLYVDTFPAGLRGELTPALLARAGETTLIARHLREGTYPDYEEAIRHFHRVWLPYRPEQCAWEGTREGTYVGPLVRRLSVEPGARSPLVVIGDGLPPGWLDALPSTTRHVNTWFEAIPAAERYLCVGAGHNLVWELLEAGQQALHLPLHRRFDDQFRRALRLGRAALSRADVVRFVREVA